MEGPTRAKFRNVSSLKDDAKMRDFGSLELRWWRFKYSGMLCLVVC